MDDKKNKTDDPKVGVFICHCGGNISDAVNVKEVNEALSQNDKIHVVCDNIFLCSNTGQELIKDKIKEEKLTHIVVASCSPSLHKRTFAKVVRDGGLNEYLYQHVNIREQNSWVHSHHPEKATSKAIKQISAGANRVLHHSALEKIRKKTVPNAIVVGAGVSGMTAALDLAKKNIPVDLIEKSPFLGGRVTQLNKLFPTNDDAKEFIGKLILDVTSNKNITVHLMTEIVQAEGAIGRYDVVARKKSRGVNRPDNNMTRAVEVCPVEVSNEYNYGISNRKAIYKPYSGSYPTEYAINWDDCTKCGKCVDVVEEGAIDLNENIDEYSLSGGVIIMATGFDPYEPSEGEFGYKLDPNVLTLPQFIRTLDGLEDEQDSLVINNRKIKNIGFVHCVGSRQIEDVHTPQNGSINKHCSRVCCTATLQSAIEIKEKYPEINIYDFYRDIRTYGERESYFDDAARNDVIFIKYPNDEIPEINAVNNRISITTTDILTDLKKLRVEVDLLVLSTGLVARKRPELVDLLSMPIGNDGFLLEAHPKLRPVESSSDGIYLAGTAQAPMDVTECALAATAASSKCTSILKQDELLLSPYIAEVDTQKCQGNGDCIEECEYNAISLVTEDNGKVAVIDPALCVGCCACYAVCKSKAITLLGYSLEQIEAELEGYITKEA